MNLLEDYKEPYDRAELAAGLAQYDGTDRHGAEALLIRLACDADALVRTEAYDSLAAFPTQSTEHFLKQAIPREADELARAYAIMSWTDVVEPRCVDAVMAFADKQLAAEASDYCKVCLWRAKYLFGDRNAEKSLISFLRHDDYHIRCFAVDFLREVLDADNKNQITSAVRQLLAGETAICVCERAEALLREAEEL